MGDTSQRLSSEAIADGLDTLVVGHHVEYSQRVGSTNDEAVQLALDHAPEGTLVIADEQVHGRGRLGRQWVAPPGTSLLFSIIFYPRLHFLQLHRMTMMCSLAVTDAIYESSDLPARIKWPNDIVIDGKKVGGILTESGVQGNRLLYAIVGVGLNVNLDPVTLGRPPTPATSLSHEAGHPMSRLSLLRSILRATDRRYQMLREGWSPRADWRERLDTLDRQVHLTTAQDCVAGLAFDVDDDGALLLRLAGGKVCRVLAGDVTSHVSSADRGEVPGRRRESQSRA